MSAAPADNRINALVDAYRSRDYAAAERLARSFTRKWPGSDVGWNILSAALHARGKLDKAAEAYRRAIAVAPDHAELHENFAALLVQLGRLDEAEQQFRESIRLNPASARTHSNLAQALNMAGHYSDARACAGKAIELDRGNASAHNILANALKGLGMTEEARDAYRDAIACNPHYAKANFNLAELLLEQGDAGGAEECYRLAIRSNPDYAKARCALGNLLAMLGRMDEAEEAYRRTLSREPGKAEAHRYLAWIKRFDDPQDEDLARVEALLTDRSLTEDERAQLHYAAGKAYQDLGDQPERAFDHFRAGAVLRRRQIRYDVAEDERRFARIAEVYGAHRPARAASSSPDAPVAVFIVGMPRSGTTLVERLIAAHPRVHGAGELPVLPRLVTEMDAAAGRDYPDWVDGLKVPDYERLGDSYLTSLASLSRRNMEAQTVTDKMPDNFRYLGLIAAAMPAARVIHVRRSPLDTCLSCYTQYFSSHVPWSYDLSELGRFYRAYYTLMEFWRGALPGGVMMEVDYEALTGDPESQARRLVEHCGLDWRPELLSFQDAGRLIQTASVAQARRAVGRGSVGRWRVYERQLAPLAEALGDLAD